jgi:glycine cleavage system aminomethyltransferase T
MVEFGGWDMPLFYKDAGIKKEHLQCRNSCGLFDVSHMVGVRITGEDRVEFAERVLPADVQALPEMKGCLTSIPNENGGLIDDCIVTKADNHLYLVINAGHEDKDLPHLEKHTQGLDVKIEPVYGQGILALQGPKAETVLSRLVENSDFVKNDFKFMEAARLNVANVDCFVTRSGYTGEDGFELSVRFVCVYLRVQQSHHLTNLLNNNNNNNRCRENTRNMWREHSWINLKLGQLVWVQEIRYVLKLVCVFTETILMITRHPLRLDCSGRLESVEERKVDLWEVIKF